MSWTGAAVTCYTLGALPVTGVGLSMSHAQLDAALSGPVAEIAFDDVGMKQVESLLATLADTDFAQENLKALLASDHKPENWRVGEALAECYLCEGHGCYFPWPDSRDERKQGSSLPGADLVGFHHDAGIDRFAFGEVKTSSEAQHPPGAVYGRHGLKQQLEDLRDRREIRDGLVRYLAHRAVNAPWRERFQSASSVYLKNTCNVRIFGLLVRDVPPHQDDLRARVTNLNQNCPHELTIELTAIYLPAASIVSLSSRVVASRPVRGAP